MNREDLIVKTISLLLITIGLTTLVYMTNWVVVISIILIITGNNIGLKRYNN